MAAREKLPYPPSPEDVPDEITDYPSKYVTQEWLLLTGSFVFLLIYFSLVVFTGYMTAWMIVSIPRANVWPIFGAAFFALGFAVLVKGFFKGSDVEKELHIELKERDHPKLFAFITRVCDETGAEEPNKIYASADVNAGVVTYTSLINVFGVQPKKDLILGLGLINCLNLSEFKAVLAHEFGHFNQGGAVGAYTNVVSRIIYDLVAGRDWFDAFVDWLKRSGGIGTPIGYFLGGCLWVVRSILLGVYKLMSSQRHNIWREREFHADLVAASVAGSDAIVHGLLRTKHGNEFLNFAFGELRKAADHKLYTADIYFHQHAGADIVRKKQKKPKLGIPPKLESLTAGRKVQVFDPDQEEDPGDEGDYHPSNYDREENVKAEFIAAPMDERSPWLLFDNPGDLRERMTYKFYRMYGKLPKGTELADPRKVQKFIDEEHAETTYDPKYEGSYDGRIIDPGDLDELNELIQTEPWPDERLATVFQKLYTELGDRAETRKELMKDYDALIANTGPTRGRKAKRLLKETEQKLDKSDEWFHSLDRRVYLVFVQMAYRVNNELYFELINRYRFHMTIQGFYKSARMHQGRAHVTWNMFAGAEQLGQDDFIELMHVLREGRSALRKIVRAAKELDMPAMKNFEEGDRLADFLLDEDIVKELPETYVKGKWVQKLMVQLDKVMSRSARLHGKSLGGILRLQEDIAKKFLAKNEPVVAEVVQPQVIQALPLNPPPG
ncbi:M48 family metallopeptidase [Limnoglobus roseus]|uniref:Protease HtpX n=1 Tax=Limnoglobus roseus TaxID=2598579 RepID=A0A5C1A736_9BACT|nr:M48 family metallopeptidase [Limnoglobus roseus]QEL14530.1 Protease HtpX [Limnoglobus roseus]